MNDANRKDVTDQISLSVEKWLASHKLYWAREVSFDKGTDHECRVDYMGFKPLLPNLNIEPSSVEAGEFWNIEVKSCMADFKSGNGLNFFADHNLLACTPELEQQLVDENIYPTNVEGTLVYRNGAVRLKKATFRPAYMNVYGRRRSASEMLLSMVVSNRKISVSRTGKLCQFGEV